MCAFIQCVSLSLKLNLNAGTLPTRVPAKCVVSTRCSRSGRGAGSTNQHRSVAAAPDWRSLLPTHADGANSQHIFGCYSHATLLPLSPTSSPVIVPDGSSTSCFPSAPLVIFSIVQYVSCAFFATCPCLHWAFWFKGLLTAVLFNRSPLYLLGIWFLRGMCDAGHCG